MKPQCTTPAECLRELSRVMEQFGIKSIIDAVNSKYVKHYNGNWNSTEYPFFQSSNHWSFAIAEVEGKPVFLDDYLYDCSERIHIIQKEGQEYLCRAIKDLYLNSEEISYLSWNPPKPKTVMVEMLVEDVEEWANYYKFATSHHPSRRLYEACKKALETK